MFELRCRRKNSEYEQVAPQWQQTLDTCLDSALITIAERGQLERSKTEALLVQRVHDTVKNLVASCAVADFGTIQDYFEQTDAPVSLVVVPVELARKAHPTIRSISPLSGEDMPYVLLPLYDPAKSRSLEHFADLSLNYAANRQLLAHATGTAYYESPVLKG